MSQIISPRAPRITPRVSFNVRAIVSCLVALVLSNSLLATHAQTTRTKPRAAQPSADKNNETNEREAAIRRRRTQALDALRDTAERARSIPQIYQRALVQGVIGDALWKYDEPLARLAFQRAWDAATDYERKEAEDERAAREEERLAQAPSDLSGVSAANDETLSPDTELREDLLVMIAKHDLRLAEKLHRQLIEEVKESDARQNPESTISKQWHVAAPDQARRLALAQRLLNKGEAQRAAEVAATVVAQGAVSQQLVLFLSCLRAEERALADTLFSRLLARLRLSVSYYDTDANAVLLLSGYFHQPENLLLVSNGSLSFQWNECANDADEANEAAQPALRRDFYQLAARALTRRPIVNQSNATEQVAQAAAQETLARFVAIERLLPFFERDAGTYVAALQAERQMLASDIEETRRNTLAAQAVQEVRTRTVAQGTDPLGAQTEQINRAASSGERDKARARTIKTAVFRKLWLRAQTLAEAIEDSDLETRAVRYIRQHQAISVGSAYAPSQTDDYERAAEFIARIKNDLSPEVAAYAYAQAARLAAKRNARDRAEELLQEGVRAAESSTDTSERLTALALLADYAAQNRSPRTWELLLAVTKLTDGDNVSGDDESFTVSIESIESTDGLKSFEGFNTFGLSQVFNAAAQYDFARALEQANSITHPLPRAYAVVATVRVGLEANK